jgi:sugar O-acyltransferase (sialic acid O-acetyltransferase NeuD family)
MSDRAKIAVYGASDGGEALVEAIRAMGVHDVVLFLDDTPELAGGSRIGLPIMSGDALSGIQRQGIAAVATHVIDRDFRLALRDRARAAGLAFVNVIHPRAVVAPTAEMGVGNVIKAGAVVDTACRLGDCCIVDNGAVLAHHCVLEDACHLAPGVSMGGGCLVGQRTLVGVGAVVSSRVRIGRNVIVSAGAAVVADVADAVVVGGNPARVIGERR